MGEAALAIPSETGFNIVRGFQDPARSVSMAFAHPVIYNGMFGLKQIRPGISDVNLSFRVKYDAEPAMLQEILNAAQSLSPVFDTVTKPVGVKSSIVKE